MSTNTTEWHLTRNATRVLFMQRIVLDDVLLTLDEPEVVIPQDDDESDDIDAYMRGDLCVIANTAEHVIIHLLKRDAEASE